MKKKPFVAQTSMVPVLACIAALLFSANFYQFMQKNFKKWWGWDFQCPAEQVDCHKTHRYRISKTERHAHRHHREHRRHRGDRQHRHDVRDRPTIILDFEGERNAERNLEEAQRNLERNLERALRDLERLHERMEWDADVDVDVNVERLKTEIRIKLENLEDLNRIQRKLQLHFPDQDAADEIIREYRVGDDNVQVRIQRH